MAGELTKWAPSRCRGVLIVLDLIHKASFNDGDCEADASQDQALDRIRDTVGIGRTVVRADTAGSHPQAAAEGMRDRPKGPGQASKSTNP